MNENAPVPRRPGVVTAAAVLLYVFAGFGLLGMLLLVDIASSMPELTSFLTVVNLALCLAYIVLATMILGGNNGAKVATILLLLVNIVLDVICYGGSVLSIGLGLLVIGLLAWNREANEYFAAHR
jgi:hypothetical protein